MTNEQIFERLQCIMGEMFELPPEEITLEANLYEDLDIDSIDAVDLLVRLKELTGKRIDPEEYKEIRTVKDIVDSLARLMA